MNLSSVGYLGPQSFQFSMKKIEDSSSWAFSIISAPFQFASWTTASSWDSVKYYFGFNSDVRNRIYHLSREVEGGTDLEEEQVKTLIEAFYSSEYDYMRSQIHKILRRISNDSLQNVITGSIKHGLKDMALDDVLLNLRIFEQLNLNQMLDLRGLDRVDLVRQMLLKDYMEGERVVHDDRFELFPLMYAYMKLSCRGLMNVVDSIVAMSGKVTSSVFGSAFKIKGYKDVDTMSTSLKLFLCYIILHYFLYSTTIGAEVLVFFPAAATLATGLGVGLVGLAIAYPILYWLSRQFRPCPVSFEHAVNMTQQALDGTGGFIAARDVELQDLTDKLQLFGKVRLQGEKGVGKTGLVRGLANKIALGHVPEFLQGKKTFHLDIGDLVKSGKKLSNILEDFQAKFEGREEEVVVFIDEPHHLWTTGHDGAVENLEVILAKFPYIILSTSPSDFREHGLWDNALVSGMKEQILKEPEFNDGVEILREYAEQQAPELNLSDELIRSIYEKSEELEDRSQQPGKALHLLKAVISRASEIGTEEILEERRRCVREKQRIRVNSEKLRLSAMATSIYGDAAVNIEGIDEDQQEANLAFMHQIHLVKKLWTAKRLKQSVQHAERMAAVKAARATVTTKYSIQKNWMMIQFVKSAINRVVDDLEIETLGMVPEITEGFVDEVIYHLYGPIRPSGGGPDSGKGKERASDY